jgi:hypothetical protein
MRARRRICLVAGCAVGFGVGGVALAARVAGGDDPGGDASTPAQDITHVDASIDGRTYTGTVALAEAATSANHAPVQFAFGTTSSGDCNRLTTVLTGSSDASGGARLSYVGGGQNLQDTGTAATSDGGKTVTLTVTAKVAPSDDPNCVLVSVGASDKGGDIAGPLTLVDDGKPPSATPTASATASPTATATASPTATATASPTVTATASPTPAHHKKHKLKHCTKKQRKHHKKHCRKKA